MGATPKDPSGLSQEELAANEGMSLSSWKNWRKTSFDPKSKPGVKSRAKRRMSQTEAAKAWGVSLKQVSILSLAGEPYDDFAFMRNWVLENMSCKECGVRLRRVKKYCSECAKKRLRDYMKHYGSRRKVPKAKKPCVACGKPAIGTKGKKYCGIRCQRKADQLRWAKRYKEDPEFRYKQLAANRRKYKRLGPEQRERRRISRSASRKRMEALDPGRFRAARSRRRARKREALHPEHSKHQEEYLHRLAFRMGRRYGGKWHVDHVVPLNRGGAHHHDNLQVIPQRWNSQKQDNPYWVPSTCPKWFRVPTVEEVLFGGVIS